KGSYLAGYPAVEREHRVRHRVPPRGDDEGLRARSIRTTRGAPTSRDREAGAPRRPRARESPRRVGECVRLAHDVGRLLCRAVVRGTPPAEDPIRGADVAGTVEAIGKNVTRFKPGDEVFGQGRGSFAEYTTSGETGLAPKPRNVSFEQAAAVPGAGYTALQGLRNKAQLKPGQRVLIYGAGGGVGTLAVQVAKALGAHVTAVSSPENLEMLRSIGADEVIDYTREDFVDRGERYDVFFDIGANRSLSA